MATVSSARPAWQRGAIFRFFASLKLAVVLLAVLIIASIAGTIYESSFDARVARTYVYGAPWFNLWLILLAANLTVSAVSRWPWRKHHVAFLVTHLGIITLLTGSLIGRIWGIEGTMTLFKGDPPTSRLLNDQHQLRVHDSDGIVKGYGAEFLHHPPTSQRPHNLGTLASGARLAVIDYATAVDAKLNPRPVEQGGSPALHFTINTVMMGQRLESWLLADEEPQHASFSLGLATVELKRGRASITGNSSPNTRQAGSDDSANRPPGTNGPGIGETNLEESIFAFAKAPEQQVGRVAKGGSTGAKVLLSPPQNGNSGQVAITIAGKTQTIDVAGNLKRDVELVGTTFAARIENYWPDFRIQEGKPASLGDTPNNPAVMVTIRGRGVPAANETAPHGNESGASADVTGAPVMNEANAAQNHLTFFIADDGAISYELKSRKLGDSAGSIELNKPLVTGWADWQLVVDRMLLHAQSWMEFTPAQTDRADMPDGVKVRVQQNGETIEQWVPAGWEISLPTSAAPVAIAYGWRNVPLPIGIELLDFEVARNEGSDAPAGFKSSLRISTVDGRTATGQCWMNRPFSFPGSWWRTWSGLTFKISQASWNPENLGQSTVQILRDPGWLLKWIGSLLVVAGVFMLFYVKQFRRQTPPKASKNTDIPARKPGPLVRV